MYCSAGRLGHSTQIVERHYLQTTDAHWAGATPEGIGSGGNASGHIPANHKENRAPQNDKIPPNERLEDCKFVGISTKAPRSQTSSNKPKTLALWNAKNPGKTGFSVFAPRYSPVDVPPCRAVDPSSVVNQQRVSFWRAQW